MKIDQITEGYKILPPIDRERYQDREHEGLEGPFTTRTGKVVYYDKREGKYYDPDTDIYISDEDYFAMDQADLDEVVQGWAARVAGKVIFDAAYKKAIKMLDKKLERGGQDGRSLESHAADLLRMLRGGDKLDPKELASMYRKEYATENQQIDPKLAMGAKQAATRMGAKGSGSRMATAMDKVSQGQAVTGQLSKEIAPFMDQLEKILANPQLRQKFMMLVKQAEQVQESELEEAPGDIRKGMAAIAMIAALWGVNNNLAQDAYQASPQLQKLTAYLEVAKEHDDQRMIDQLESRIENHKARLDIGKGDVMGKDGSPIDVVYDKEKNESTNIPFNQCPSCGDEIFHESEGKKDACYHKVRSKYKVWPSAYASGALVQCRKKGAKNWGNSK